MSTITIIVLSILSPLIAVIAFYACACLIVIGGFFVTLPVSLIQVIFGAGEDSLFTVKFLDAIDNGEDAGW